VYPDQVRPRFLSAADRADLRRWRARGLRLGAGLDGTDGPAAAYASAMAFKMSTSTTILVPPARSLRSWRSPSLASSRSPPRLDAHTSRRHGGGLEAQTTPL